MSDGTRVALAFGIAFMAAVVGTPLARGLATRLDVLDHPRKGKSHLRPTPYLGGLAIIGASPSP